MKLLLLTLVLFGPSMDFKELESLIGEDISYVNKTLTSLGFKHREILEVNFYKSDDIKLFYEMDYDINNDR